MDKLLLQVWPELLSGGDRGQVRRYLPHLLPLFLSLNTDCACWVLA